MFLSRMDIWLLEAVNQIQDTLLNCIGCFIYRRIKEICNKNRLTWIRTCSSRNLRCVILLPWCLNSSGLDCGEPCCVDALFTFQFLFMFGSFFCCFYAFVYHTYNVEKWPCFYLFFYFINFYLTSCAIFYLHLWHHVASLKKKWWWSIIKHSMMEVGHISVVLMCTYAGDFSTFIIQDSINIFIFCHHHDCNMSCFEWIKWLILCFRIRKDANCSCRKKFYLLVLFNKWWRMYPSVCQLKIRKK